MNTHLGRLYPRVRSSALARNAAALYAVHIANLVLPLATIPFLARVLQPEGWGVVVFTQSFAFWLGMIAEYGFHLSGTRLIARHRGDDEEVASVVAGVHGAKALLAILVSTVALVACFVIPTFRSAPPYLLWGWLLALSLGGSPLWYFQGMERMAGAAMMEVTARVVATLGIFLFIRGPEDGWIVLALQGGAGLAWLVLGTGWIYREVVFRMPSPGESLRMLREGGSIFALRSFGGLYTQGTPFILGVLGTTSAVAFFGGADRLARAAVGLIQPASQALFPRLSNLARGNQEAASRLLRRAVLLFAAMGLVIGGIVSIGAPLWVRILLGPGYEPAVSLLRILGALGPIIAMATVIGIHWALPLGHDRPVVLSVVAAGIVNVTGAILLVPRLGAEGMALSVIAAEATVLLGLLWFVLRQRALKINFR